jgi:HK97 family phage portal protein
MSTMNYAEGIAYSEAALKVWKAEQRNSLENPAVPLTFPVELLADGLWGPTTDSGVRVNQLLAMQNATVNSCVRVIAESVGQLPLGVFEEVLDKHTTADDLEVYELLHDRPNPFMSSAEWREAMMLQVLLWGNSYSIIERDEGNRPIGLWPRPSKTTFPLVKQMPDGSQDIIYSTRSNTSDGLVDFWTPENIIHLKAMSFDGVIGLDPIRYFMKNAVGLAIATEQFGARFFGNGAKPQGILMYKGPKLDPAAREATRKTWQEAQAGYNQGKVAVLDASFEWKDTQITPEQGQFLLTRKLQKQDIAGMYRVPAHMIGDLERSTNNNIEQQSLEFSRNCLAPWLAKFEAELGYKLLPRPVLGRNAARKFFVKFDVSELTQGDFKTMMGSYAVGLVNGVYSVNAVLKMLKVDPIGPEGDLHTIQNQNVTLQQVAAMSDAAIKEAQNPTPPPVPIIAPPGGIAPPQAKPPVKGKFDTGDYRPLFRDAFNRLLAREKRDKKSVSTVLDPLVTTFGLILAGEATEVLNAEPLPEDRFRVVIEDQLEAIAKRAESWKPADVQAEFDKTIRSLRVALYSGMAVQKAKEFRGEGNPNHDANGRFGSGSGGASAHPLITTTDAHTQMANLYNSASSGYSGQDKMEHSFTIDGSGKPRAIQSSHSNSSNSVTVHPGDKAIVHTHPKGTDPKPSDADVAIAVKFGIPNYAMSADVIWVANPDGTTAKVGDVSWQHGDLDIKFK